MIVDYKSKFESLKLFLREYKFLHDIEFIKKYPMPYPALLQSWLEDIREWSLGDVAKLESFPHERLVKDPLFKSFLKSIRELSEISERELSESTLPNRMKKNLNPKKIHEIQNIKSVISKRKNLSTIIDIGGGVGYLSSSLVYDSSLKSICIDINEKLQVAGRKRLESIPECSSKIEFINVAFDKDSAVDLEFSPADTALIGLHACGDLSSSILRYGADQGIGEIINFGCCYHKIENDFNMSNYSKNDELRLTRNALHLASRCGSIVTEADLQKRYKQKRFRYTFHYLIHSINESPFRSIGNALPADYHDFYEYSMKFDHDNILGHLGRREINDFYNEVEAKVWDHYLADTIRLLLGRVIETYIVLDRAIFLQERGYSTTINSLFNRDMSPRNIMLNAKLEN